MNLHCIEEVRCENGESAAPTSRGGRIPDGASCEGERILAMLSKRQEEILLAACLGTPDKIIADNLGVSPRTLEGHWRAIHRKLGSVNRCQAGFLFAALRENMRAKVPA
jgi:DNA-binding NarL/FixJ family response regulator